MSDFTYCPNCDATANSLMGGTFRILECRDCGKQFCYLCYGSNEGHRCPKCKSTDFFTAGTCYPKR
jgi:hypothetical protein